MDKKLVFLFCCCILLQSCSSQNKTINNIYIYVDAADSLFFKEGEVKSDEDFDKKGNYKNAVFMHKLIARIENTVAKNPVQAIQVKPMPNNAGAGIMGAVLEVYQFLLINKVPNLQLSAIFNAAEIRFFDLSGSDPLQLNRRPVFRLPKEEKDSIPALEKPMATPVEIVSPSVIESDSLKNKQLTVQFELLEGKVNATDFNNHSVMIVHPDLKKLSDYFQTLKNSNSNFSKLLPVYLKAKKSTPFKKVDSFMKLLIDLGYMEIRLVTIN